MSTFIFQWFSFFIPHVGDAWKIWMDCLELWVQMPILWKWGHCPFNKVSLVCKCLPGDFYQKRTSELSQMWLSSLWEMWYSMFTHSEDHRRNWSHNDKNTTLEGVSRAFWISRIQNKSQTHERYFYSADWWRYGSLNFRQEPTQGKQSRNVSVCEFVYTNCHICPSDRQIDLTDCIYGNYYYIYNKSPWDSRWDSHRLWMIKIKYLNQYFTKEWHFQITKKHVMFCLA